MNISDGPTVLERLRTPFPVNRIHWRVGARNGDKTKGIALAYVDARDVQSRLDEVAGIDWQSRYSHVGPNGVVCEIGLRFGDEWLWRSNGAGETDVEAQKGALSDAFKRAAVMWGVAKYLYALPNDWVDIAPAGKSSKLVGTPSLPAWATPEGYLSRLGKIGHAEAVTTNLELIVDVKRSLSVADLESAAATFAQLPMTTEATLNRPPSKGGVWTTKERATLNDGVFCQMVNEVRIASGWHESNTL